MHTSYWFTKHILKSFIFSLPFLDFYEGHTSTNLYFIFLRIKICKHAFKMIRIARGHSFSTKIFQKTIISFPSICTFTCTYEGVRNVSFSEILRTYQMNDPHSNQKKFLFESLKIEWTDLFTSDFFQYVIQLTLIQSIGQQNSQILVAFLIAKESLPPFRRN